jgi:hypothetical protein
MKGRQFLLTSAHLEAPLLFETRWVMSYLKGPVSLQDIGQLTKGRSVPAQSPVDAPGTPTVMSHDPQTQPPLLKEGIEQRYHLLNVYTEEIIFEPWLAAEATVRFYNSSRNIDELSTVKLKLYLEDNFKDANWHDAEELGVDIDSCPDAGPEGSRFCQLPENFSALGTLARYQKDFSNYLYQNRRLELFRAPSLKLESRPGESEADFVVRISDRLRQDKEAALEKLAERFQVRRERLTRKLESAHARLEKEKSDVSVKTSDTILSFGTAVLGAFLGRKAISSSTMTRTASSIRKAGRIGKEKDDVRRAEQAAFQLETELQALEDEQREALQKLVETYDPAAVKTETFSIKPRRADIFEVRVCLLWEMAAPKTAG